MEMPDCAALVRAFYDDIWNRQDLARIPELLDREVTFRGSLGRSLCGHGEFRAYVEMVHAALADYRCDILDLVCENYRAFARMLFHGRHVGAFLGHPPTGRHVQWHGAALFTVVGARIVDLWVLGDLYALIPQLAQQGTAAGSRESHP